MKSEVLSPTEVQAEERPLLTIAAIADLCAPDRLTPRKCVGCVGFDENPDHCADCYAQLYPRA